jgi:hypothetical protein
VANKLPTGTGTRTFTGARAVFMWNGEVVAFASGVNGGEEISHEPVEVLDHLEVMEHAPTAYRVSLSASIFRTIGKGSQSTQDSPGSLKQQQIFPRFDQILRLEGVEVMIQDSVSGKVLYLITGVKASGQNFQISARGIVGQNVNFVALKMLDESEIS